MNLKVLSLYSGYWLLIGLLTAGIILGSQYLWGWANLILPTQLSLQAIGIGLGIGAGAGLIVGLIFSGLQANQDKTELKQQKNITDKNARGVDEDASEILESSGWQLKTFALNTLLFCIVSCIAAIIWSFAVYFSNNPLATINWPQFTSTLLPFLYCSLIGGLIISVLHFLFGANNTAQTRELQMLVNQKQHEEIKDKPFPIRIQIFLKQFLWAKYDPGLRNSKSPTQNATPEGKTGTSTSMSSEPTSMSSEQKITKGISKGTIQLKENQEASIIFKIMSFLFNRLLKPTILATMVGGALIIANQVILKQMSITLPNVAGLSPDALILATTISIAVIIGLLIELGEHIGEQNNSKPKENQSSESVKELRLTLDRTKKFFMSLPNNLLLLLGFSFIALTATAIYAVIWFLLPGNAIPNLTLPITLELLIFASILTVISFMSWTLMKSDTFYEDKFDKFSKAVTTKELNEFSKISAHDKINDGSNPTHISNEETTENLANNVK